MLKNPLRCLLIDDDADDQDIFIMATESLDILIEVQTAINGVEGLEKLNTPVLPDYIFLDLNMPRMNGKEFLKEIKRLPVLKEIPVFIYTTSSAEHDKEQTLALGAFDFITKPSSITILANTLNKLLLLKI